MTLSFRPAWARCRSSVGRAPRLLLKLLFLCRPACTAHPRLRRSHGCLLPSCWIDGRPPPRPTSTFWTRWAAAMGAAPSTSRSPPDRTFANISFILIFVAFGTATTACLPWIKEL
ncbi:hypothetical protein VPH35_002336 [Triticum aestivum]